MNDLRLILLGIGLLIIAGIYFWGTYKQKIQDRSQMRKLTSFKRDTFQSGKIQSKKLIPDHNDEMNEEVNAESFAELDEFLSNPKSPEINTAGFSLRTKAETTERKKDLSLSKAGSEKIAPKKSFQDKPDNKQEDMPKQSTTQGEIITFLIKANADNAFSGSKILKATEAVGFEFGEMNIFHHHGTEDLKSEQAIFSLASMYEPGYFDMEKMRTFQTNGLVMFMQLPTPVDNMIAFNLMQETAMKLADILDGEIWSSKHKPIDEKALLAMRDVVAGSL